MPRIPVFGVFLALDWSPGPNGICVPLPRLPDCLQQGVHQHLEGLSLSKKELRLTMCHGRSQSQGLSQSRFTFPTTNPHVLLPTLFSAAQQTLRDGSTSDSPLCPSQGFGVDYNQHTCCSLFLNLYLKLGPCASADKKAAGAGGKPRAEFLPHEKCHRVTLKPVWAHTNSSTKGDI